MIDEITKNIPQTYLDIDKATKEHGFTMPSEIKTCSLLRTLAASKPSSTFLELGTGTGLSTCWILDGMDENSSIISFDNDESLLNIAQIFLGNDTRLNLVKSDGEDWVRANEEQKFDYIFADTWHGKYLLLEEVLSMLNKGGFYIIDDMLPQSNWPEGHHQKCLNLVQYLENREDLLLTKQEWASGIIVAVKK